MSELIIVREARMEDLPEVQALTEKLWERDPKVKDAFPRWMQSDWIPEAFPNWIKDENNHPLAAVDPKTNKIVGIVNAEIIDQGETAWFEGIRIDPDYQRHGIGRKLTEELLKWGQTQLNVKHFRLVALRTNKASLSLTKKLGFKEASFLNGYNIPVALFPREDLGKCFDLDENTFSSWQEVSESNVDEILQWFKDEWSTMSGHPTIGLGGLYLAIKRENIEYLMSGWTFLIKRSQNNDIQGIVLLRGSRSKTEEHVPSRAILCVHRDLANEAIKISCHHVMRKIEPDTTDLRVLGRFLDDQIIQNVLPKALVDSLMSFTPVLMEKKK